MLAASRATLRGLLQWQITVRPDGQRLLDGALPTLIQWGDTHPTDAMPDAGLTLRSLTLRHPQAPILHTACSRLGLAQPAITPGPAALRATPQTPRGTVELVSPSP